MGRPTTSATLATWTPSPCLLTAPSVPLAARTPRPCSGISMTASICTLWTTPTPSTPSHSALTGTGCAPPPGPPSRFGILRARTWLRSSDLRCPEVPGLIPHSACPSPGALMAKPSSLDTVTTSFVSGRCLSLAPGKRLSAKKSPALPLLEKKHRVVELSWTWPWSARCTGRSKLYVHIVYYVFSLCAYAAQPEFCGCNLNKLEGQNVFVFTGCVSPEYSNCNKVGLTKK